MKKNVYAKIPTEKPNPRSNNIDRLPIAKVVKIINEEDQKVPRAIAQVERHVVRGVQLIVQSLKSGGRLFFVGAGTSGRLGILEAAECPPTFNTPPTLVQAVIAGGKKAVFRSVEVAEDKQANINARRKDIIVGIAASGVTPFVLGALQDAKSRGAKTILIACNAASPMKNKVDCLIAPKVGPEIITGSTRLKAGTATKLILNMLTVASMIQLGKVYKNFMVDLQPKNKKLTARALRIIEKLGNVSSNEAVKYLDRAKNNVKLAILMAKKGYGIEQATRELKQSSGFLRDLIHS